MSETPSVDYDVPPEPPIAFRAPGVPDREVERFALDADVTVYWPWVRPCWEDARVTSPAKGREARP